jgi:hypothetical protein
MRRAEAGDAQRVLGAVRGDAEGAKDALGDTLEVGAKDRDQRAVTLGPALAAALKYTTGAST